MITSLSNPRIKAIRKLRDRKERQETGLFYVEGLRIAAEAGQIPGRVETLIHAPELLTSSFGRQLVTDQANAGVEVLEVSKDVFEGISLKEGPVGIAAVVRQSWVPLSTTRIEPGEIWVALDSVADPGNLGTILRTLDAAGGSGLILLDHSTDPYDPTAVRASMGALFSLKLVRADFPAFAQWKQTNQAVLVGTSDRAEQDYHQYRYPNPVVLLMGSERQGLQPHHFELCDAVVSIPMAGRSDSLNLAVATGITLYEIFNQRRDNPVTSGAQTE